MYEEKRDPDIMDLFRILLLREMNRAEIDREKKAYLYGEIRDKIRTAEG